MEKASQLVQRTLTMSGKFVTPASLDEFKQLAKTAFKGDELKQMGIDDLDKALTSPRDGQPYVLVPGVNVQNSVMPGGGFDRSTSKPSTGPKESMEPPVLLYDKKGSGGRHLAAMGMMGVRELTDEELAKKVPSFKP
jgi:hypothetical protein